jgi:hypothetical protein
MYVQCQYIQSGNFYLNLKINIWTMKIVISIQKNVIWIWKLIFQIWKMLFQLYEFLRLQKSLFETKNWDFNFDIIIPKNIF